MRAFLAFFVPVLCALYLMDKYEFDGHYADLIWTRGTYAGQQYQQQLNNWWHR
jgi:hypothetical protein